MSKVIYIEKKSVAPINQVEGAVSDTLNVVDKVKNAPSINLVQQMTGIPQDGVIAFDGDVIPEGYEEVDDFATYSTEEFFTGKYWINGKKIYSQVVDLGNLPNNAVKNVHIYIPNVEFLLPVHGCARGTVESLTLPNAYLGSAQTYIDGLTVQFTNNAISTVNVRSNSDRSLYTAYAILEYTKTTD